MVERGWIAMDTTLVAKMDGQRQFCSKENGPSAEEQKEELEERAAHHRELVRAFADPNYDGFYTGPRSIDSEADIHSLLKNKKQTHPFVIGVEHCDPYNEER